MAGASKIEWTDATWNPVRGCRKISPGCKHCYAATFAERFRGVPGHAYEQGFDPRTAPDQLNVPLSWKRPRKIFVNSMSDLFLEDFDVDYIAAVCAVMRLASHHTYQVLTKRSERMRDLLRGPLSQFADLRHIWWGVSVEDKTYGLPRIAHLQAAPVAVRILSVEPLLEDLGVIDLTGIHQVIVGGESGHGARPCDIGWIRAVVRQCNDAGVPVFVKQLGAKPVSGDFTDMVGREARGPGVIVLKDRKGGDWNEWTEDLRVRQFPEVA